LRHDGSNKKKQLDEAGNQFAIFKHVNAQNLQAILKVQMYIFAHVHSSQFAGNPEGGHRAHGDEKTIFHRSTYISPSRKIYIMHVYLWRHHFASEMETSLKVQLP
jgi:hypothetical protein